MLRKATFRYIEQEIYDYKKTKRRVQELRIDYMLSTPEIHEVRTPDPKDPTLKITTRIMLDNRIRRMELVTDAIQQSLVHMLPDILDIFEDKYWKRPKLSWSNIADIYHISESTLYRHRREFIEEIAKELGTY